MSKQSIHILYLSGLGDHNDSLRLRLLRLWKYKNVTVELVPMKWREGTFEQKIARIDRAIDRVKNAKVVLIGESAGGSMAVHMYARRDDIHKVMTLCGKNTQPEKVSEHYIRDNPSFGTSMERLSDSLAELTDEKRRRFVSIHPIYDPKVPVNETLLPNCRQVRLWAVGHFFVIILALTIYSPIVIRAAKQSINKKV